MQVIIGSHNTDPHLIYLWPYKQNNCRVEAQKNVKTTTTAPLNNTRYTGLSLEKIYML